MELRKNLRIPQYDYSAVGCYFITVCTAQRQWLFWRGTEQTWRTENASLETEKNLPLSALGQEMERSILQIPQRYPGYTVDRYVIMPDHVHLLLRQADMEQTISVSRIMQQMKGYMSKFAGKPIWQRQFYDRVIRNYREYQEIWEYIDNNPRKWFLRTEDP